MLPQGQVSELAREFDAELRALGIFLVQVGELERWAPDVPGHGPQWVTEALERRLHEDVRLPARAFVTSVAAHLAA
jgi:hypothetical protein